jgi:hypothetical protein
MGFSKSEEDPNLYFILVGIDPLILVFYMDDLFLTGAKELIVGSKEKKFIEFEMKEIGLMHYFFRL